MGTSIGSDGSRSYVGAGASERVSSRTNTVSPVAPRSCSSSRRAASNRVPTPRTWIARSIRLSIADGDTPKIAAISFELWWVSTNRRQARWASVN